MKRLFTKSVFAYGAMALSLVAVLAPASAKADLIVAAGGGGGAGLVGNGLNASLTTSGGDADQHVPGDPGGVGGVNGAGGTGGSFIDPFTGQGYNGGGGGGWLGNGTDGAGPGPSPANGGLSGYGGFGPPTFAGGAGSGAADSPTGTGADGGFGGGGGGGYNGGGGGGGYSGGGGGDGLLSSGGGGGGSYFADLTGVSTNYNAGLAYVEINGFVFTPTLPTDSIQTYTITADGTYDIIAAGAIGGQTIDGATVYVGGYGAYVEGSVYLTAGTVLDIVVGGAGTDGDFGSDYGGGGGGGSFVYTESSSVPEPTSFALLGLGGIGSIIAAYRRRRSNVA